MQVVASLDPATPLAGVPAHARRVEAMGYDALHVAETVHDAFAVSLLALEHTSTLVVRTSIVVAFPRSPMVTALAAWGLAAFSSGRFQLGLGTQIRQNIVDRFSTEWRDPVGRMGEYIDALAAIWHSFQSGDRLRFEGDHYRFTRLQPHFNPGPIDVAPPAIWLGGVNAEICRLAGKKAAGFVTHPTNSNRRYLESICLPNLRASRRDVALVVGGPLITGADANAVATERERRRAMLAMLYSTPEYRRTLELYGWTELADRLRALTREQRWDDMAALVGDDVLDELVPQATYDALAGVLHEWYGDVATGILVPPPVDPADDEKLAAAIEELRQV